MLMAFACQEFVYFHLTVQDSYKTNYSEPYNDGRQ